MGLVQRVGLMTDAVPWDCLSLQSPEGWHLRKMYGKKNQLVAH